MLETEHTPNPAGMPGFEAAEGFESSSDVSTADAEPKKVRYLRWLQRHIRVMLAAELGLLGTQFTKLHEAYDVINTFVYQTQQQRERPGTAAKEQKLKELFGEQYPSTGQLHYLELEEGHQKLKQNLKTTGRKLWQRLEGGSEHEQPQFDALETQDGILTAETIQKLIRETTPRTWGEEVASVRYEDADGGLGPPNAIGEFDTLLARCKNGFGKEKSSIIFYKWVKRNSMTYVIDTILHEEAHANGLYERKDLNPEERADFALAIAKRTQAQDRYHSSYVERIHYENSQKDRLAKAQEYWAEICYQYFKDATKLNVKDLALVDFYARKSDPSFNWKDANTRYKQIVAQALKTQKHATRR